MDTCYFMFAFRTCRSIVQWENSVSISLLTLHDDRLLEPGGLSVASESTEVSSHISSPSDNLLPRYSYHQACDVHEDAQPRNKLYNFASSGNCYQKLLISHCSYSIGSDCMDIQTFIA